MKRVLALMIILMLFVGTVAMAEDEQKQKNIDATVQKLRDAGLLDDIEEDEPDDAYMEEYLAGYQADNAKKEELCIAALEGVLQYESVLNNSVLDDIVINPNAGTEESGDFIALAYLTYTAKDAKEPSNDKDTIVRNSCTVANAISRNCPGVVELTVFWKLPEYNSQAKVPFIIEDKDYEFGDHAMFPKEMVN